MEDPHTQLGKAFMLCLQAHQGQKRRTGEPFYYHPVEAAMKLFPDTEAMTVALLHDVAEQTEYTVLECAQICGLSNAQGFALECLTQGKKESISSYRKRLRESVLATKIKCKGDIPSNYPTATERKKKEYDKTLEFLNKEA